MNDTIQKLSEINGPSGGESMVAQELIERMKPWCGTIFMDSMGNLFGFRKGTGGHGRTILLCAHMDEVGMIVSAITDDGYVKFKTIGGIDEQVLLAKRVRIGPQQVLGVTGVKAVHLMTKEERNKKLRYDQMYIDIGAFSKEEAEKMVRVGDLISFDTKSGPLGALYKGKAFDDRTGCAILLELMQRQYEEDLWFCFTVQEETGLRGATVAARRVAVDACVVVENTTCLDLPGVEPDGRSTVVGNGPAITIVDGRSYADPGLRYELEQAASAIPHQYKNVAMGGNDAGAVHLNNIRTAAVSVPCRYLHSPICVCSMADVENCIALLDEFIKKGGRE